MSEERKLNNRWCVWLMVLSVAVGLTSLCFAFYDKELAALIAATLSVFWSGLAAGFLAVRFSARRTRVLSQERVVDKVADCLVKQLEDSPKIDCKDGPSKAELVDRLHGMALKALDESSRRT